MGRQVVPDDRRARLSERAAGADHLHSGYGATVAFFPVYPVLARWFDYVFPGGVVQALLGVNVVLSIVAVVLIGMLGREVYDVATPRAMVLFASSPVPWYCRGLTPKRRSSSAPRPACCSCSVSSGCSPARRGDRHGDAAQRHRRRRRLRRAAAIAIVRKRSGGRSSPSRSLRSACSPSTSSCASTPASRGRGCGPSATPGTRGGVGGLRRCVSRGDSSRTRSGPNRARPTCTRRRPRGPRLRPVLLHPHAPAAADRGLRRRDPAR